MLRKTKQLNKKRLILVFTDIYILMWGAEYGSLLISPQPWVWILGLWIGKGNLPERKHREWQADLGEMKKQKTKQNKMFSVPGN